MKFVTGTKRSGTSLWMQLLIAAGYPFVGNKFPRNWEEKLKAANPRGFYESELRNGVYFATNPHPKTGRYLRPDKTDNYLVKAFIPGLVKSDVAFLDHVVASIRPWRQVVRSIRTMRAIEADVFGWGQGDKVPAYLPPEVEWLRENFLLVRDLRVRGYPHCVVPHGQLMADPEAQLHRVLTFLNGPVDKTSELAEHVDSTLFRNRTSQRVDVSIDGDMAALLDTWDAMAADGKWDDLEGLTALNNAWKLAIERKLFDQKYRWDDPKVAGPPQTESTSRT